MSIEFTDTERAILRIVQYQLPDTLTPYADARWGPTRRRC